MASFFKTGEIKINIFYLAIIKIYIFYLVIKEVITGFGYRNIVWCSHSKPHWINHRRWITTTAICTKAQFNHLATMVIKMSIHITRSDRVLRLLKVKRFTLICRVLCLKTVAFIAGKSENPADQKLFIVFPLIIWLQTSVCMH